MEATPVLVRGILTAVASVVAECGLSGAQASVVGTRTQLPHSVWDLPSVCVCVCAQLCPTLCSPMDCSMPGSFVHWISRKNTRVGCHFLLQGIFLIQGSNPHHLHWQADSLTVPPGKAIFLDRGSNRCSLHCKADS